MKDKPARLTRAELQTLRRLQEWLKQNPLVGEGSVGAGSKPAHLSPTIPPPGEE
jgi:hypothetical protein